jgi:hypothetical protein
MSRNELVALVITLTMSAMLLQFAQIFWITVFSDFLVCETGLTYYFHTTYVVIQSISSVFVFVNVFAFVFVIVFAFGTA